MDTIVPIDLARVPELLQSNFSNLEAPLRKLVKEQAYEYGNSLE